jgi:uncharacterized repeat protein (TIGR03803 family)
MKMRADYLPLSALIVGLGLLLAGHVAAQTFTTLHNFTANPRGFNGDGNTPRAGLILSGNTLYGTAYGGGGSGSGTVFKVNTDGTTFTNVYSFTALFDSFPYNSDGAKPYAGLILSGNTLYGTASGGGSANKGTIFKVNTDGTGFTNLHIFSTLGSDNTNSDGAYPCAGLILSGNTLYGAADGGGSAGCGTIFAVNTDGTGFTNLHSLIASEGGNPVAALILSGNTLYGTASGGGSADKGTVFKINTDGTGFTNLHSLIGSEGVSPVAALILSGNTLYGTARYGGSADKGTVFKINTDGTGFTNLYKFTATHYNVATGANTNSDGANPYGGLILSGNTLYGTANVGGSSGRGTVYAVKTDGTDFKNLHNFTGSDGTDPESGLILSGNMLYGTTIGGGSLGYGTVFSLAFAPQLTIAPSETNVILTWPTSVAGFDYTGFTLQCATNLDPSTVWSTVSPTPVIVNEQNTVTNPISGAKQFYRLSQ